MKICQWNIENLYLFMDNYDGEDVSEMSEKEWQDLSRSQELNKHIQKLEDCSRIIKEIDPDLLMLNEVGGLDSLNNFNHYFLNDKYDIYMEESQTRIQNAFLVKKGIPAKFKFIYSKDIKRGISQLEINDMKFWLIHLKSMRGSDGDFMGLDSRKSSIQELINKHTDDVILSGDFNGNIDSEPEFFGLLESLKVKSFHESLNSKFMERVSHVGFYPDKKLNQMDYILVPDSVKVINGERYLFKNDYGDCLGLPDSLSEKKMQPSDHFPLVVEIELNKSDHK